MAMSMNSFHARSRRPAAPAKAAPKREADNTKPAGLERADVLLVRQGLAFSRAEARRLIEAGRIAHADGRVGRPAQLLADATRLVLLADNGDSQAPHLEHA